MTKTSISEKNQTIIKFKKSCVSYEYNKQLNKISFLSAFICCFKLISNENILH